VPTEMECPDLEAGAGSQRVVQEEEGDGLALEILGAG
jgi:hypothetical protein